MPCGFNFLGQCHTTYRVLVPQPGIKSTSFALERRVLVTGPPGELLTALLSEHTIRLHFPASCAVGCGHLIGFWTMKARWAPSRPGLLNPPRCKICSLFTCWLKGENTKDDKSHKRGPAQREGPPPAYIAFWHKWEKFLLHQATDTCGVVITACLSWWVQWAFLIFSWSLQDG